MIEKYWALYTDEIDGFDAGDMVVGTAWPVNLQLHRGGREGAGRRRSIPSRGRHGLGRHVDDVVATPRTRTAC